jgi:hypothetical protein
MQSPKSYKSLTLCSETEILWIQIIARQNGKHHNQIWDQSGTDLEDDAHPQNTQVAKHRVVSVLVHP